MMTAKRLAKLYDALYDRANKLFKEHDLCAMTKDGCRGGEWGLCACSCNVPGLHICKHFDDEAGCTTRMLGCKLRYCHIIEKIAEFGPVLARLDRMRHVMDKYGIRHSDTKRQMVKRRRL